MHHTVQLPTAHEQSCLGEGSLCITAWLPEISSTKDLMKDPVFLSLLSPPLSTARSHSPNRAENVAFNSSVSSG